MLGTFIAAAVAANLLVPSPPPVQAAGFAAPPVAAAEQRLNVPQPPPRRSPALTSLYVSFAALQALDVHSTLGALGNGTVEANPAMRRLAGNRAAFITVKAAAGASTIWMTEKLRRKHPRGALVLMAALNSVMATVVAHNYSIQ